MSDPRETVRALAREHLERGDACGWFERLYAAVEGDWSRIPWADLRPNPWLLSWLAEPAREPRAGRALVVGCGLGDDAEALAAAGFAVTAFDLSPTAVAACRRRFPASAVRYEVRDLLAPPAAWRRGFDLVFEAYTLQSVPPAAGRRMLAPLAGLVAAGGRLLLVCRGRDDGSTPGAGPPWPLARADLASLARHGLTELRFEDASDPAEPVRRFRMLWQRPAP